jgi:hypothetical protein
MDNLWPNFDEIQKIKTPKEVLEEQGKILPKLTNGYVYSTIDPSTLFNTDFTINTKYDFTYDFNIKGRDVENYKFKLFTIGHTISIYPIRMRLDPEIRKEIGLKNLDVIIDNNNDFVNILREILNSDRLKYVIASIISLSR